VTGGADGFVVAWSLESGHRLWKVSVGGSVVALAFAKEANAVLSCETDGLLRFWSLGTGTLEGSKVDGGHGEHTMTAMSSLFGGRADALLFTGDSGGNLKVWRGVPGPKPGLREVRAWGAHEDDVTSVAYSTESRLVVSSSMDGRACMWTLDGVPVGMFGQDSPFRAVPRTAAAGEEREGPEEAAASGEEGVEGPGAETAGRGLAEAGPMPAADDSPPQAQEGLDSAAMAEDEYKLLKLRHHKKIYGRNNVESDEDKLFRMAHSHIGKRHKGDFVHGWKGRAGKKASDVFMQLGVHKIVDVPNQLGTFIHRPIRPGRAGRKRKE
jgi:hypothetical protein